MTARSNWYDNRLEDAWTTVNRTFPFPGYVRSGRKSGYFDMVRKVAKWTHEGAEVLDFGAGPCDKTAMFALAGMRVTAYDTLADAWHRLDGNIDKILEFAKGVGIEYCRPTEAGDLPFANREFDVVMSHDVFEHFHSSPRVTLNNLLETVRPGGILAITVPNAANLRKRIALLFGETNYNRFEYFYWYPGVWQGHVREYVKGDLKLLARFLRLDVLELSTYNLQLDVLPRFARRPFALMAMLAPGVRDSWMLVARKPAGWHRHCTPDGEEFGQAFAGQYYDYSNATFDWET